MEKFKHKKSLGQNFLKDEKALANIVNSVDLKEDDLVIEIGPGQGALTKKLIQHNVNLICFEVDERTKPYLSKLENDKTKIVYQDFLSVDLNEYIKTYKYNKLYVIANIPYYITTPIVKKIIDSNVKVENMVLMVQNEVADRFSAEPGSKDYGEITVYLNYYFNINKLFVVPKTSFDPVPKVDSAVIKFSLKTNKPKIDDEKLFFDLIHNAFLQKRKNLKNNLKCYDLNKLEKVLTSNGYSLQSRAEQIPLSVYIEIANTLSK